MALDGTNSGLIASVGSWLNRADLAPYIPDWITASEAQLNRRFIKEGGVRQMQARDPLTITAEYTPVPNDFGSAITIWVSGADTPSGLAELEIATPAEINRLKAFYVSDSSEVPTHFAIVGNTIQFYPWNGGTVSAELTYNQLLPGLAANPTGNWLSKAYPDAYLYTVLMQSAPFLKNDARLSTWGTLATGIVQDIVDADKMSRMAATIAIPARLPGTTI